MNRWPCVDFGNLTDEIRQPQCGQKELTILGGRCSESNLEGLFQKWNLAEMPFRIWEYCSEIVFEKSTIPRNFALLERGRVFGEGGDLMLRRNGIDFEWRFIGPAGIAKPTADYEPQNYWKTKINVTFHKKEETSLLWGKWNGDQWIEDRVGAAKLNYPVKISEKEKRLQLNYKTFTHAGIVAFVWFTGLSEWEG
jgi:hypothetical protein